MPFPARELQFLVGRSAPKWVEEATRKMKSGQIFARTVALSSGFTEQARARGSLRGEMGLHVEFVTVWPRIIVSRANRFPLVFIRA